MCLSCCMVRRIIDQLRESRKGCTMILCDDSSSINLLNKIVMHGRWKHIDVRYHFLNGFTEKGVVEFTHFSLQDQLSCIMTRPLKLELFCGKFYGTLKILRVHQIVKLIIKWVDFLKKNNYFLSLTIIIIKSYLPKVSTK